MRGKRLLAAFLLGVGLYFVPVLGYGEVDQSLCESKARAIDIMLLKLQIAYLMDNPTGFLHVDFFMTQMGLLENFFLRMLTQRVKFLYTLKIIEVDFLLNLE